MSRYRVRVSERGLAPGQVGIDTAVAILTTLRMALKTEIAQFSRSGRGRRTKLVRESMPFSIVGIEDGSGTMVFASDTKTLPDLPSEAFQALIVEARRGPSQEDNVGNVGIQRALLQLQNLFSHDSPVEWIEFIDRGGNARVDSAVKHRIDLALRETFANEDEPTTEISGRLLELNIAQQTFQMFDVKGKATTIKYDDLLQDSVKALLNNFVIASIAGGKYGTPELLNLRPLDVPLESAFNQRKSLRELMAEQGVGPIRDTKDLALEDFEDQVSLEEFATFVRTLRRGNAS